MRNSALLLFSLCFLTACSGFFSDETNNGGGTTSGTPRFAYTANFSGGIGFGSISAYTVNASTGALTAVIGSPFATGTGPDGIGSDAGGKIGRAHV